MAAAWVIDLSERLVDARRQLVNLRTELEHLRIGFTQCNLRSCVLAIWRSNFLQTQLSLEPTAYAEWPCDEPCAAWA